MTDICGAQTCFSWSGFETGSAGDAVLKQQNAMNSFLQEVERRALRMAELATGNRDDALEIVQEAMLGLARRYANRPGAEWKPLFYRILHSKINDFHRRRAVRNRVMAFMPFAADPEEPHLDPIENASNGERENPLQAMQDAAIGEAVTVAIGELPLRQQQAFVLRSWEGLSVRDTAVAMSCSEGSVKTHYARAVKALQQSLREVKQ